jgi:hypothetical protein
LLRRRCARASARHFDILNENIVFPLHAATTVSAYRNIYEARRNAYGQALVLLNSSSHDEDHYNDPFEALIRYAVNSTIDGVPLIFPGQELGLSGTVIPPNDTNGGITPFGYDRYETNFGKPIPHFKKYNSLMPLWLKTQPGHAASAAIRHRTTVERLSHEDEIPAPRPRAANYVLPALWRQPLREIRAQRIEARDRV